LGLRQQSTYSMSSFPLELSHRVSMLILFGRWLIVIPSILPEVGNDIPPWHPPFLDLMTSRRNRLRACLILGKAPVVSVTLFPDYEPCSTDLNHVMVCGETRRQVHGRNVPCALVRLFKQDRTNTPPINEHELDAALRRQHASIKAWSSVPIPFLDIRLLFTAHDIITDDFITRLSVDLISWHSIGAYICCDGKLERSAQQTVAESLHLDMPGALFSHALAFGRAVSTSRRPIRIVC
jgi:hypothetical protein